MHSCTIQQYTRTIVNKFYLADEALVVAQHHTCLELIREGRVCCSWPYMLSTREKTRSEAVEEHCMLKIMRAALAHVGI